MMNDKDGFDTNGETSNKALSERLTHYADSAAATRARLALDAGRMGSWAWDVEAGTVTGDPEVARLFGIDYDAQPWPVDMIFSSIHREDVAMVEAEVQRALDQDVDYDVTFRNSMSDENPLWMGARGRVTQRDASGQPQRMVGVNWDATPEIVREKQLELLAGEMDHRVKNAFAVMRALINLGQRSQTGVRNFADTLKGQVQALADAHAISARMARSQNAPAVPVPILEVLRTALEPWLDGRDRTGTDIHLDIDGSLALAPRDVSSVAMLAYELTTNATKYGPLGHQGGTLHVAFADTGEDAVLSWTEELPEGEARNVAKAAADNDAKHGEPSGFGSTLIRHCAATLGARIRREMTPTGLHFELRLPGERLVRGDG